VLRETPPDMQIFKDEPRHPNLRLQDLMAPSNNPFSRKTIRKVVEGEGYECPEVCSPEELLEVDK